MEFTLCDYIRIPNDWRIFVQCSVTRFGTFFYQIRLDALRQHPLLYVVAKFGTGGGSPTRSKQLW